MTTRSVVPFVVSTLFVASCSGGPRQVPPLPPKVAPEPAPAAALPAPTAAREPVREVAPDQPTKLSNGLHVLVAEAPANGDAQIQLCIRTGSLAIAPGLAELAAEALVAGADASQGRPPLDLAIAALGGIVRVEVGPSTTWIDVRVPGSRWQDAQAALLAALTAPARTRSQLERIREDFVQAIANEVRDRPALAMARATLLAAGDTATRVSGVLDRDPSEVGLFQARFFRPENAICALRLPGDPASNVAAIERPMPGSLVRWAPPALSTPSTKTLASRVATGVLWAEQKGNPTARVSLITFVPDLAQPDATTTMVLQALLTLDGAGGRLERLQAERGLAEVRWTSELVHGADRSALVLTTDVPATEVMNLWTTIGLARRSLHDVPPTPSELDLAIRRARLTTGLGQLDEFAVQRTRLRLLERGVSMAAIDRAFATVPRPGTDTFATAVDTFLAAPTVLFVDGGTAPIDAKDVRRIDLLPTGFTTAPAAANPTPTTTTTPWLDRAIDAIGSAALLRRFRGFDYEGRLQTESAPPAKDTVVWRVHGTVRRSREVLGARVDTVVLGDAQTESLGDTKQTLTPREAALVRREMERHPLALLAAHAQNRLHFHDVAQRTVGDRDLMVLQADGDREGRLRVHIDTTSHLIRAVEVWETLPDGTTVHLHDAWSDYRTVNGLRVPFRRVTTQDDGQNRVETVFTKWRAELAAP